MLRVYVPRPGPVPGRISEDRGRASVKKSRGRTKDCSISTCSRPGLEQSPGKRSPAGKPSSDKVEECKMTLKLKFLVLPTTSHKHRLLR